MKILVKDPPPFRTFVFALHIIISFFMDENGTWRFGKIIFPTNIWQRPYIGSHLFSQKAWFTKYGTLEGVAFCPR